jgi:hypothetical protein
MYNLDNSYPTSLNLAIRIPPPKYWFCRQLVWKNQIDHVPKFCHQKEKKRYICYYLFIYLASPRLITMCPFGLSVGCRIVNLRWPLAYFCLIWTYFISWHISTYFTSLQNFVGYDRYGKVYLKVLKSMIEKGEGYAKKEADRLSRLLSGVSCNLLWDVSSMQLRWSPQEICRRQPLDPDLLCAGCVQTVNPNKVDEFTVKKNILLSILDRNT